MTLKGIAKTAAVVILISVFTSPAVWAQFRSAIEGTVVDTSGAVIAEAQVVLMNIDTGVSQTSKTNSTGFYSFPTLPPGRYRITASAKGFASVTQENLTLGGDIEGGGSL
jgi:hypothetical protein